MPYELKRTIGLSKEFDVVVTGGGPAGCTAAAAAARGGARTLLIEQTGALGGMGTSGLVPAWCPFSDGEKMIYRGLAERVFRSARSSDSFYPAENIDWVPIEAEKLKRVYDRLVTEYGVTVLFFTTVCSVEKDSSGGIDSIIAANRAGLTAYRAKVFIDATGDGDVAAMAGASFELGDSSGELQRSTLCFSVEGVNTFNFQYSDWRGRDCAFAKTPFRHESFSKHFCVNITSPVSVGFNAGHMSGFRADGVEELSRGMMCGRAMAADTLEDIARHAPEVFGSAHIGSTASLMGIREGRRFRSRHMLTYSDYCARRSFADEIGRNSYYIDIHGADAETMRKVRETSYGKGESHGIPYGSLVPEGFCNLLLSGRCVSADRLVYGSIRVMPPCLVTGEASGVAAAIAVRNSESASEIDTNLLRSELKENGACFQ